MPKNYNNLTFSNVTQNTDEWTNLRAGKMTGSKLALVMAHYGKGFGDPAKRYAVQIALERITGNPTPPEFCNDAMNKGSELEPVALMLYEQVTFSSVKNGGFYYNDFVGVSVDGNVCDDGIIEAKVAISSYAHFSRVKKNEVDSGYKWQCVGNLYYTDRQWIDFVSYCPTYPEGKQLFILRLHRSDFLSEFEMIRARVNQFKLLVDSCMHQIKNT